MRAAIYARKSTEERGVTDDQKSVARQIEHAREYAARKGWTVADEHVYSDDGVSGAEFVKRPGFIKLMTALKPRSPFQVLIMSEESRLGREQIQTAYALQQITDAGVQVWFYLTDQERKLDTAMEKAMSFLSGIASEFEREKTGQRVHDTLLKKARALHVVGCDVYGYDNVEVKGPDGTRQHVVRKINPTESDVIVRIFTLYASGGIGLHSIAKQLNADGIAPPRGDRQRGWVGSCIRAMLHRELYRGGVVWNKTKSVVRGGTSTSIRRPESEWHRFDAPELRIISPELWAKVEQRLKGTRTRFARTKDGRLLGRPSGEDLRSNYLLSGIAQCAICGGSLKCQLRRPGDGKNVYVCAYYHGRGRAVCANDLRIQQGLLDSAILHGLTSVLDEKLIAEAVKRALAEIRAGQTKFPEERLALERQLSLLEARLGHLVEAIATGQATAAIFAELQKEEAVKKTLAARLAHLDQLARVTSLDAKRIEKHLVERAADAKALLGRHIPQARQMLRKLIEGRIVCTPFNDARGRGYVLTATGTYAGLLGKSTVTNGGGEGGI